MIGKVAYSLLFFSKHLNFIKSWFFFLLAVYINGLGLFSLALRKEVGL